MNRAVYVILVLILLTAGMSSCRKKICPAYSSAMILDKELLHKTFLAFGPDSTPDYRGQTDHRNRFGITKPIRSERKKRKKLKMIELKTIFPQPDDPIPEGQPTLVLQDGDSVVSDTRGLYDSTGRRTDLPAYNVDQENYNFILKPILDKWSPPLPPQPEQQLVEEENLTRKERRQKRREARKAAKEGFIQVDEDGNPILPKKEEETAAPPEPDKKEKRNKKQKEEKQPDPEPADAPPPASEPPPADSENGF